MTVGTPALIRWFTPYHGPLYFLSRWHLCYSRTYW